MTRQLKTITPPAVEPITLAELKTVLLIDTTEHDTRLTNLIVACRQQLEKYIHRALITQTLEMRYDYCDILFPLTLWQAPIQSVTSIKLYDTDNAETTWDAANYTVLDSQILWNSSASVEPSLRHTGAMIIQYVAGYGDAATDVPAGLRQALMDLCQFEEECVGCAFPAKIKNQLDPYICLDYLKS